MAHQQTWATVPFYLGSEVISNFCSYTPVHFEFFSISKGYQNSKAPSDVFNDE